MTQEVYEMSNRLLLERLTNSSIITLEEYESLTKKGLLATTATCPGSHHLRLSKIVLNPWFNWDVPKSLKPYGNSDNGIAP